MADANGEYLSLSQRAHLLSRSMQGVGGGLLIATIILIGFAVLGLFVAQLIRIEMEKYGTIVTETINDGDSNSQNDQIVTKFIQNTDSPIPPDLLNVIAEHQENLFLILAIIIIVLGFLMIWLLLRGLSAYKKLAEWDKDYLSESYIMTFETTPAVGASAGERVLNHARKVLPELMDVGRKIESDPELLRKSLNVKAGSLTLDLALPTKYGLFIVKDFGEETITVEGLKEFVKGLKKISANKFRIICVIRKYNESLISTPPKDILSQVQIDLVIEEGSRYSVLWIS